MKNIHLLPTPKEEPDYTALLQPVGTKQETLEEVAKNYAKESIFSIEEKRAFIDGAEWQQEQDKNKYSEEDLDAFRKFMIQEQNFSKSCLDVFVKQFKKK